MKFLLLTALSLVSLTFAEARVDVMFHPQDPTLRTIAERLVAARSRIDIAMYNMDATDASPIVRALKSPAVQARIQSGDLKIRMILELYSSPADNEKKRQLVESFGIDVRDLANPQAKIHHKFAVIDAGTDVDQVITGSANWSMASARNYNENILFFDHEAEVTARYQQEFNRLWVASQEVGAARGYPEVAVPVYEDQADVEVFFNSPKVVDPKASESTTLTEPLVQVIDAAKSHLEIATTRIRLVPVLEALLRAAERGVKIQALISQDDLRKLQPRAKYLLAHPNLQLRVKFYNLKVGSYIAYQMHNKFMIVDGQMLFSGSFNWSHSSENLHIENVVKLSGAKALEVLPKFESEFKSLWDMGRNEYAPLVSSLKSGTHTDCEIPQMALTVKEIRELLPYAAKCK